MNRVAVVIPVYKALMDQRELTSLCQTFFVLGDYPLVILCPKDLDVREYVKMASGKKVNIIIERFDQHFFEGVEGYNRLLLSECFYQRFSVYEYILICQLDAYVFRDELKDWCEKGYDYIGAPLFHEGSEPKFSLDDAKVGNGGLSLRRVKAYLDFFHGRRHVVKISDIAGRIELKKKPYTRWFVWLLMVIGWRNTPRSVARHWKYNEDVFWSLYLHGTNYSLCKPSVFESLSFAFERFPSACYGVLGKLPFGCHAWWKYQYDEFWKDIIGRP